MSGRSSRNAIFLGKNLPMVNYGVDISYGGNDFVRSSEWLNRMKEHEARWKNSVYLKRIELEKKPNNLKLRVQILDLENKLFNINQQFRRVKIIN